MNKNIEHYQDNKENKIKETDNIFNAVYFYHTIQLYKILFWY